MDCPQYAILRVEKIKSEGDLCGSVSHNNRTRETKNANEALTHKNLQLYGFDGKIPTAEQVLRELKKRLIGVERRKDAVICQEAILTASPEFFNKGKYSTERFTNAAMRWLHKEFGDMLMSATLHLDEQTPHIHAYIIPTREGKNKHGQRVKRLSAKTVFCPETLKNMQTTFAEELKELGLSRGKERSKAKYVEPQQFAKLVQQGLNEGNELNRIARQPFEVPKYGLELPGTYAKKVADAAKEHVEKVTSPVAAIAATNVKLRLDNDRLKGSSESNRNASIAAEKKERAAAVKLQVSATETKVARELAFRQGKETAAAEVAQLKAELAREKSEAQKLKDELKKKTDSLRDIPLHEIMHRMGHGEPAREGATLTWRISGHAISATGAKWYDHKENKGGGKAIDLVMHLQQCGFCEAVAWLAAEWSPAAAEAAVSVRARETVETAKRPFSELEAKYCKRSAEADERAKAYLVKRGVSGAFVEQLFALGRAHGGSEQRRDGTTRFWCVFRHLENKEKPGATLRACDDNLGAKRSLGNKTENAFVLPYKAAPELVFVESPVDALAYKQLNPLACVISCAGVAAPLAVARAYLSKLPRAKVVVALDADRAGDEGAARALFELRAVSAELRLFQCCERKRPPVGKDWADTLFAATEAAGNAAKALATAIGSKAKNLKNWLAERASFEVAQTVKKSGLNPPKKGVHFVLK